MEVSKYSYTKAKLILAFIKNNPNCHIHQITAEFDMVKAVAQIVISKMVKAECLTYVTRKHQGGKRYYYTATGKQLPPRGQKTPDRHLEDMTINLPPIEVNEYVRLPSFLRALTPVILPEARRSTVFNGHTVEQHKLQSKIIRRDRAVAQRGAISTGESRL